MFGEVKSEVFQECEFVEVMLKEFGVIVFVVTLLFLVLVEATLFPEWVFHLVAMLFVVVV